jgi:hypothetical protein
VANAYHLAEPRGRRRRSIPSQRAPNTRPRSTPEAERVVISTIQSEGASWNRTVRQMLGLYAIDVMKRPPVAWVVRDIRVSTVPTPTATGATTRGRKGESNHCSRMRNQLFPTRSRLSAKARPVSPQSASAPTLTASAPGSRSLEAVTLLAALTKFTLQFERTAFLHASPSGHFDRLRSRPTPQHIATPVRDQAPGWTLDRARLARLTAQSEVRSVRDINATRLDQKRMERAPPPRNSVPSDS